MFACQAWVSFLNIDNILNNASQLGNAKNVTTPLHSDTTKRENCFNETVKIAKTITCFYNVEILHSFNPDLKKFKLVKKLVLQFKKIQSNDKALYSTFYSNAETIINESDIDDAFEAIYSAVISSKQKFSGQGSSWLIDSVIEHNIDVLKYNHLAGSYYIKLPKILNHSKRLN